jgi:hypothetical protein
LGDWVVWTEAPLLVVFCTSEKQLHRVSKPKNGPQLSSCCDTVSAATTTKRNKTTNMQTQTSTHPNNAHQKAIKRFIAQVGIYGMYSFGERPIIAYVHSKGKRNDIKI